MPPRSIFDGQSNGWVLKKNNNIKGVTERNSLHSQLLKILTIWSLPIYLQFCTIQKSHSEHPNLLVTNFRFLKVPIFCYTFDIITKNTRYLCRKKTCILGQSVEVIVAATSLHWFDLSGFKLECNRILKPGGIIVAIYCHQFSHLKLLIANENTSFI